MQKSCIFILVAASLILGSCAHSSRGFTGPCRDIEKDITREEESTASSVKCEGNRVVMTYQSDRRTIEIKPYQTLEGGYGVEEGRPVISLAYVAAKKDDEPIAAKIRRFDFTWGQAHELVVQRRRVFLTPKLADAARWYDEYEVLSVKKKESSAKDKCFMWVANQNAVMRLSEDKQSLIDYWKKLDPKSTLRASADKIRWKLDWLTSVSKFPIHMKVCAGDHGKDPITIMTVKKPQTDN